MKIIKDLIYGYIDIENEGCVEIVNTPYFQRLRDILQTSYTSVYPTSLQNRFTHSLGVFYLGKIALKTLVEKLKLYYLDYYKNNQKDIFKCSYTFEMACLLHDIGHAPFSHTGEAFFLESQIWQNLKEKLNCLSFNDDAELPTGAAHEIMSALISIKYLFKYMDKSHFDKELFTRCIIGLKYKRLTPLNSYKNCLIEMLHSDTIDVDRLDYLIRDSFMSGYCSVDIDYSRLLTSIHLEDDADGLFKFTFTKNALSVLENVILAHDLEKKWLQTHPSILYESCLIEGMIKYTISSYSEHNTDLFSEKALSEKGLGRGKYHIKLLSDSDVKSFVKRFGYKEECVKSYFERSERRKPFWKSEAEYKVLFESRFSDKPDGNLIKIEEYFDKLNQLLNFEYLPVINDNAITKLRRTLESEKASREASKYRIELLNKTIKLFEMLSALAKSKGNEMDFVIISAKQFQSGFNKEDFKKIKIWFPSLKSSKNLSAAINVLENKQSRVKFFYIFAPQQLRKNIECSELLDIIADFSRNYLEK